MQQAETRSLFFFRQSRIPKTLLWEVFCLSIFVVSDGEGNGNTLQCLCLENPRDRGAWQVAVHGVAKSWTRLKQLSTLLVNIGFAANFWLL